MGLAMSIPSFIPGGLSATRRLNLAKEALDKHFLNLAMEALDQQFMNNINDLKEFHTAVLEIFDFIKSTLPDEHFDVPKEKEIEEMFRKWKEEKDTKALFVEFLEARVKLSKPEMANLAVQALDKQFMREIKDFDEFHTAVLDIFNFINSTLPGKRCEVPERKEIEEFFSTWKDKRGPDQRKTLFVNFLKRRIDVGKPDNSTIYTGLVTPPAAMAAKRAAEPQLQFIKAIPDILFVPTTTVLALISVKLGKTIFP